MLALNYGVRIYFPKNESDAPEVIFIKNTLQHLTQNSLSGLNERLKYGLVATGARGRLLKATPTMSWKDWQSIPEVIFIKTLCSF